MRMKQPLVTIVVPVYKVEKYIDRCLQSILNQTYTNLEVILVDDGSPDSCPTICDAWKEKDSRIKVIHKQNAGLGYARNTGIESATGEYIFFWDSDDYVDLHTVELALNSAIKYESDIVKYGTTFVNSKGEVVGSSIPNTTQEMYAGDEVIDYVLRYMIGADTKGGKQANLNMSAWGSMFSMRLIRECKWNFVSERDYISEDFYSSLELYQYVRTVSIVKEPLYYYCYNSGSLTHIYDENRFERVANCYEAMTKLSDEIGYPTFVTSSLATQFLGSSIGAIYLIIESNMDHINKIRCIKKIFKNSRLKIAVKKIDLKQETIARKLFIICIKYNMALAGYMMAWLNKK